MADYVADHDEQVGPSVEQIMDLYAALKANWAQRNADYARARRLYKGEHWGGAGSELEAQDNRYSLTINYIKPNCDKDVQILMGTMPGLQVLPPMADDAGRLLAERLEGVLYGNYRLNDAHKVFLNATWDAVVLRRGYIYYYWDPSARKVCFHAAVPDNFYPVYDGERVVEAIYVSRRLTRQLRKSYPHLADQITQDDGYDVIDGLSYGTADVSGGTMDALQDDGRSSMRFDSALGYTTVIDYYDEDGVWVRIMGDAVHRQMLGYPEPEVPFLCIDNNVAGTGNEPMNAVDQIAELNLYYDQLISARADVIKKWANPPIIDRGSGVDPAKVKQIVSGDGGVLPINPRGALELLTWQGTVPEITEQLAEVKEALYDLSGKPRSAYGQTITNQSGVMTNLSLTPTLQSNELRETLWGDAMIKLNRRILQLYERYMSGQPISFKGVRQGKTPKSQVPFEVEITGQEINGWYENRIKWPSQIRTDDPAFVQMELSKLQSTPQAQSMYDTLENLGVEDVENWIDRIRAEHEDPRLHPEIFEQAVGAVSQLAGTMMPPDQAAATGNAMIQPSGQGNADYNQGMIDSGNAPASQAA